MQVKSYQAWLTAVLLTAALAADAAAQQPGSTVQLPTFSRFSGSTTVSVPDRGSVYLGGVNRAASGRNSFRSPLMPWRPSRNSALGTRRSAANMHVTATIHDFEAMDRYLLSQPTSFRPTASRPSVPAQPRRLATRSEPSLSMSVADARARRIQQQQTRRHEAVQFFERGREVEAAGKLGVAKIYYQMAARRATGPLADQVAARLEALDRHATAGKVAGNR